MNHASKNNVLAVKCPLLVSQSAISPYPASVPIARIDFQLRLRVLPLFLVHSCQGSDGLAGSGFQVSHGWLFSSSFASSWLYLGGQKDFQVWIRSFFSAAKPVEMVRFNSSE